MFTLMPPRLNAEDQDLPATLACAGVSRHGGPYGPDEITDKTGLYGRACAATGGAESVEFLIQSLGDLEFGHEAAVLTIWKRNVIDELRDDYGSVEGEPRHPDIESGRPWPIV